jgi:hypothetical protein
MLPARIGIIGEKEKTPRKKVPSGMRLEFGMAYSRVT